MSKDVNHSELSALNVKLIQWDNLPFRSDPKIMAIWGSRDPEGLKALIDRDGGIRDALQCARIKGDLGKPILFDGYTRLLIHFARAAEGKADNVPAYTVVEFDDLGQVLAKVLAVQTARRNVTAPQIAHAALQIKALQGFDISPRPHGRPTAEKANSSLKRLPGVKALSKEFGVSDPIIRIVQQAQAHQDPKMLDGLLAKPEDEERYLSPLQVKRKIGAYKRDEAVHSREKHRKLRAARIAKMTAPKTPDEIAPDGVFTVDAIDGIKRIAPGTIDLCCTSIPYPCDVRYDNAIPYDGDYEKYLDKYVRQFLAALKPALKSGGRVAINFDCTYRGYDKQQAGADRHQVPNLFNLWADISRIAEKEIGLHFMAYRIWYKQNCPNYFGTGSRSSRTPMLNPNTEFILIFAKDSMHLEGASDITDAEYDKFALSHWYVLPQKRESMASEAYHPCPFPEEIPYRLIKMYCPTDGVVLDPFSGSATTAFVAKALGRPYIALDNSPLYNGVDAAQKRLATLDGLTATEKAKRIERFVLDKEHGMPKHRRKRGGADE